MVVDLASEKGRKGGESSPSSSASDRAFKFDLAAAYRGLRANALLLVMSWPSSESEDEELSMAEELDSRSIEGLPYFGDVSTDFRLCSRLGLLCRNDEWISREERCLIGGECVGIWVIVLAEDFRDSWKSRNVSKTLLFLYRTTHF